MCRASEHNGKAAAFVLSLSIWGMGFDIKLIMEYILTTCWAVVRVCSGVTEKGEEEEMSRWGNEMGRTQGLKCCSSGNS